MKKSSKIYIALASILGIVAISVGVANASLGSFASQVADRTGYYLAQLLSAQVESSDSPSVGAAGDTYQTAKTYSKVITSNATTTASIPCGGWLITGVNFYVTPGAGNSATTSITIGVASSTSGVDTSLATDTFSTSTAVYQTYSQADGSGQLCSSSEYVNATLGGARTSTNGVLSVEYLIYQ